jgi:branched-chain amino acid transport system substrate-binding protein
MRKLTAVVFAAVCLVATACSGSSSPSNAITLGAIYPTSGKQGPGGVDEANGAKLAVEYANQHGGVHGRPMRLDLLDVDAGGAAPSAVDQLHAKGIDLILGSYGSTISAPAAVAAHRDGMLLWETGAVGLVTADAGPGQSFFRVAPMGAGLGRSAVAFVRDQLAPLLRPPAALRYAVAYVDDAYGAAVGQGAIDEIRSSGQILAGTFPYDVNTLDAPALVRSIAAAKPDVLFVSAYLNDGIAIRKETVTQGVPLLASIGTSSSYCMPAFGATLGPAATGLFASDKPDGADVKADVLTPDARAALEWARAQFKAKYHEEMTAPALSGFSNTLALVGHVLPASPSLSPAAVAETARTLKLAQGSLPNGAGLDFAAPGSPDAGENRAAVSVIWQWVDPHTQAVVWPPAFATRPLQLIPIQT